MNDEVNTRFRNCISFMKIFVVVINKFKQEFHIFDKYKQYGRNVHYL